MVLINVFQEAKKVTFRPFKSIVIDDFAKDLASLPLLTCQHLHRRAY